jgi:tellurite resistance protein TerC
VHLEKSVVFMLFFVGAKLMLHAANELFHWPGYEPTPQQSIVVILGTLGLGVVASLLWPGDCAAAPAPRRPTSTRTPRRRCRQPA